MLQEILPVLSRDQKGTAKQKDSIIEGLEEYEHFRVTWTCVGFCNFLHDQPTTDSDSTCAVIKTPSFVKECENFDVKSRTRMCRHGPPDRCKNCNEEARYAFVSEEDERS